MSSAIPVGLSITSTGVRGILDSNRRDEAVETRVHGVVGLSG